MLWWMNFRSVKICLRHIWTSKGKFTAVTVNKNLSYGKKCKNTISWIYFYIHCISIDNGRNSRTYCTFHLSIYQCTELLMNNKFCTFVRIIKNRQSRGIYCFCVNLSVLSLYIAIKMNGDPVPLLVIYCKYYLLCIIAVK